MNIKHGSREPFATIYPVLLILSTGMAAVFCYLYLKKPAVSVAMMTVPSAVNTPAVVHPPVAGGGKEKPATAVANKGGTGYAPSSDQLPGDKVKTGNEGVRASGGGVSNLAQTSVFEETNMRVQHVLTAETPSGDLSRIVLDVPVLIKSGTMAWSAEDVSYARDLLKHLMVHQEKTQALREEGAQLLKAWNYLVEKTVPTTILRADSPTLPSNQKHLQGTMKSTNLDSQEAIKIQPTNP